LRNHFEQNRRPPSTRALRRVVSWTTTRPARVIADAIAAEIDRQVDYRAVETDGAREQLR
jgi:hypothetical protein